MDLTPIFLAMNQNGESSSSSREHRGRQLVRPLLPPVRIQDSKDEGYKIGMTYRGAADATSTATFRTVNGGQIELGGNGRMPLQAPFVRGFVESIDSRDSSIEPVQHGLMRSRRGTDPRFRSNLLTGSPKVKGATMIESVAGSNGSSPLMRATANLTTGDQSSSGSLQNHVLANGVPLGNMAENAPEKSFNILRSGSSPMSGHHSSQPSSTGSAIAKPGRNDQLRLSSEYNSYTMRMIDSSYDSTSARFMRKAGTDNSASSTGLPLAPPQYAPSGYASGSRPSTAGGDAYASNSFARPVGGYTTPQPYGANNIWTHNGPFISSTNAFAPAGSGYTTAEATSHGGHPYASQEPTVMYRASTHPAANARPNPVGMQRGATYNGPYGYAQDNGYGYQQQQSLGYGAVGSRLNANAAEFSHRPGSTGQAFNPSHLGKHVFLHPNQQINWRHLLEPGVTADWDLIVDKIISSNDQQASIFLQQKIKNSEPALKDSIIDGIINRGLELMGNRFGNFLIQRVFECANHAQIMGLASHIEGHTVRLSTDAFGCHVIQKAFDCVPESFKHQMVRELLTRIRDTIVHRYACHVWQKLFELRWQGPPPMIMGTVNAALVGQWTQVAVGETGSLVVQNIFENCNEDDKRPCINEVLANLDFIARGQYGNWCIQHICEHGEANDRDAAINMILARAADYSMDQYASKCIEKCLKVCGTDFLDRYLQQVLMRGPEDTFSPLVQIARDQYGNFLIQWVLNNASPHLRDIVQAEIRKHLVSLRGNKYGSKVALTCGYGPQGVRPGVPFAPAGYRHGHHNNAPRGPPQYQTVPNHSVNYSAQYQHAQVDGAIAPQQYGGNVHYAPPQPPRSYLGSYGGPGGPYPQY